MINYTIEKLRRKYLDYLDCFWSFLALITIQNQVYIDRNEFKLKKSTFIYTTQKNVSKYYKWCAMIKCFLSETISICLFVFGSQMFDLIITFISSDDHSSEFYLGFTFTI